MRYYLKPTVKCRYYRVIFSFPESLTYHPSLTCMQSSTSSNSIFTKVYRKFSSTGNTKTKVHRKSISDRGTLNASIIFGTIVKFL